MRRADVVCGKRDMRGAKRIASGPMVSLADTFALVCHSPFRQSSLVFPTGDSVCRAVVTRPHFLNFRNANSPRIVFTPQRGSLRIRRLNAVHRDLDRSKPRRIQLTARERGICRAWSWLGRRGCDGETLTRRARFRCSLPHRLREWVASYDNEYRPYVMVGKQRRKPEGISTPRLPASGSRYGWSP